MPDSLASIADFIRYTYSRLNAGQACFGHGSDNSWDESVHLVLQSVNLPWDFPSELWSCRLTFEEKRKINDTIKARVDQRIPLAYLTQQAWFCGHRFYVDERVLIPRSPIGELIESRFMPWSPDQAPNRILDLCTGSGCIGIACALEFELAQVDLLDVSEDALSVAKINVDQHELGGRVRLMCSDLFSGLGEASLGVYDMIVSNPPYVDAKDYAAMPDEYHSEPSLGLVAGEDGLLIVRRILAQGAQYLTDDGFMVIEVGNSWEALEAAYPDFPFTWVEFERGGHGVFVIHASELKSRVWE